MNYDINTTAEIIALYMGKGGKPPLPIAEIAKKFGRSEKSIIGKLAKEGVYVKKVYKSKTGEIPETKKEIIARLAVKLNINPEKIQGLEKAPKIELKLIEASLSG